jgi:RimJ/RimL family protein N-acetyltransferase
MNDPLVRGESISIRLVQPEDLEKIAPHAYSVSIVDPLTNLAELRNVHARSALWQTDSGAVSITLNEDGRLVGTCQFFRSGPCIHGLEIGYIVHAEADRSKGFASEALRLLSDYLFDSREQHHRHQLTIENLNEASCRVAEKCNFDKEGILRSSGFPPDSPADCFVYSKIRERGV